MLRHHCALADTSPHCRTCTHAPLAAQHARANLRQPRAVEHVRELPAQRLLFLGGRAEDVDETLAWEELARLRGRDGGGLVVEVLAQDLVELRGRRGEMSWTARGALVSLLC